MAASVRAYPVYIMHGKFGINRRTHFLLGIAFALNVQVQGSGETLLNMPMSALTIDYEEQFDDVRISALAKVGHEKHIDQIQNAAQAKIAANMGQGIINGVWKSCQAKQDLQVAKDLYDLARNLIQLCDLLVSELDVNFVKKCLKFQLLMTLTLQNFQLSPIDEADGHIRVLQAGRTLGEIMVLKELLPDSMYQTVDIFKQSEKIVEQIDLIVSTLQKQMKRREQMVREGEWTEFIKIASELGQIEGTLEGKEYHPRIRSMHELLLLDDSQGSAETETRPVDDLSALMNSPTLQEVDWGQAPTLLEELKKASGEEAFGQLKQRLKKSLSLIFPRPRCFLARRLDSNRVDCEKTQGRKSISTGTWVLAAIVILAFVAALGALVYWWFREKKNEPQEHQEHELQTWRRLNEELERKIRAGGLTVVDMVKAP